MVNNPEQSSLAQQYEVAVRRNRNLPNSLSLAPREKNDGTMRNADYYQARKDDPSEWGEPEMATTDKPEELLEEWLNWWKETDETPAKMPNSLHVRTAIFLVERKYDGSNASVISAMTGYTREELDAVGGVPEQGDEAPS